MWRKYIPLMANFRRRLVSFSSLLSSNLYRSGFLKARSARIGRTGSSEDEIVNIRQGFDAGRERFLRIPDALNLKEIPKVDPKGIYVNKNLRLNDIKVYGFDCDCTLRLFMKYKGLNQTC